MGDLDKHPDAADIDAALAATEAELEQRFGKACGDAATAAHDSMARVGIPDALVHVLMRQPYFTIALAEGVRAGLRTADADHDTTPALDDRLTTYLDQRGHTLSFELLDGHAQWLAQAEYVLGEAEELVDAVEANDHDEDRGAVFDELADVVLSATTLARYLGTTVEACIERKTTKDTGRG